MTHPIAPWARLMVRFRALLLLLAFIITGLMAHTASKLAFDFSPDNIFLNGDPAHAFYVERFSKAFSNGAKMCIIAVDGDLKSPNTQKAIYALHQNLAAEKELGEVRSLVNTDVFHQKDGVLQTQSIFHPDGTADNSLIDWASGDPMLGNLLIAKDKHGAAIVIKLALKDGDAPYNDILVHRLQDILKSEAKQHPQVSYYLTGLPVTQEATITMLKMDQLFFVPMTMFLMAILLFLSFRSLRGVVLPFLATGAAAIWALGWLVIEGHPINMVNNSLIVLLLVIGVADAIHVMARYEFELRAIRKHKKLMGDASPIDRDALVAHTVQYMMLPVTLTTATAAIGFAASCVADVGIIRHFGMDAALGIMGSLFTTMLIVPGILRYLPLPKPVKETTGWWSLDHILERIGLFSIRHAKPILWISVLVFVASIWMAKDMRPQQTFVGELPAHDPSVLALKHIENRFTGIMPVDLVFEGTPTQFEDPAILRQLARSAEFLRQQPMKPTVVAFTDILQSFGRSLTDGADMSPVSTWSDEKIAQLLMLINSSDPEQLKIIREDFFSPDGMLYRIRGLGKDSNTQAYSELRDAITQEFKTHPVANLKSYVTGSSIISANALNYIMFDLGRALATGIGIIFVLMTLLFRSVKYGLIGLLPNLIPIALAAAFMQTFDISFRVATVIIFTMAIGIAVDTSIHLLSRFQQEMKLHHLKNDYKHLEPIQAILLRTLCSSGRPVVYAMLILFAGFSVMGFSKFIAIRDFGLLSGITLGSSLIIDLMLVPALIMVLKPKID